MLRNSICLLLVFFTAAGIDGAVWKRSARNEYKMCIPDNLYNLCKEMTEQETKSPAKIICIPARDRLDCLEKIKSRQADFGTVDPEDMYIAAKLPEQDFTVFEEIRTKEEPDAEFRYEAVAVIHKNLTLHSLKDLKGLKSCHTGVGRNVGYKIPLTKLKKIGIIGNLNNPDLSPRENELKALSELFSKACIVGKWSEDAKINAKLKNKYSNLCSLCEHPENCDYPDQFSGYEGALKCLASNGGDIAWTKVIYVRKFFGLPVGTTAASTSQFNPDDFSYLCSDGSTAPIQGTPCRWAARPWQGYLTNADMVKSADELRRKIENLNSIGQKNHAKWLEKVLELNEKTLPKENKIIGPGDYLDKANYTDVIERDYGPPFKTIKFCVTSAEELEKCHDLSKAAFSRNIRPRIDCVQEMDVNGCLKEIQDDGADLITLPAKKFVETAQKFNLKPILQEEIGNHEKSISSVAIVSKKSDIKSFEDLKGKKACFNSDNGFLPVLYTLVRKEAIKCPYEKALEAFFAGLKTFKNDSEALKCLVKNEGDVAFVNHLTVPFNTDGKNLEEWSKDLKSQDFELLCPNGGRFDVNQFEKCRLLEEPTNMIVTDNEKSLNEIEEIQNALTDISSTYIERPDWFKLFGVYKGQNNLLFQDATTGLVSINSESESLKFYSKIVETVKSCS